MFWILALKLAMGQATELEKLDNYMHTIAPSVGRNRIVYVAKIIRAKAKKYDLDPYMFATIIKQESNFGYETLACTTRSCDYGLAQINDVNIERYHLDRQRLLTDDYYNLETAARILSELKQDFPNEHNYFSRFHDARPKERAKYEGLLNNWKNKGSEEFADDRQ